MCLPVIGEFAVDVRYEAQQKNLVLKVVAGNGPCLLGRNWLEETKLNWKEIKPVSTHTPESLSMEEKLTVVPLTLKVLHIDGGTSKEVRI